MRFAHNQAVRQSLDRSDQRLMRAILDDQSPGRGAALPSAQEGRLDHQCGSGRNVCGIPDDQRIVPAHFEREDLARRIGILPVERDASARRAREQQSVNVGMARQRPPFIGPADQQPDDPFGNPGGMIAIDQ